MSVFHLLIIPTKPQQEPLSDKEKKINYNVLNRSTHYLYFRNAVNTVSKTVQINIKHTSLSRGLHFTALNKNHQSHQEKRKLCYLIFL